MMILIFFSYQPVVTALITSDSNVINAFCMYYRQMKWGSREKRNSRFFLMQKQCVFHWRFGFWIVFFFFFSGKRQKSCGSGCRTWRQLNTTTARSSRDRDTRSVLHKMLRTCATAGLSFLWDILILISSHYYSECDNKYGCLPCIYLVNGDVVISSVAASPFLFGWSAVTQLPATLHFSLTSCSSFVTSIFSMADHIQF